MKNTTLRQSHSASQLSAAASRNVAVVPWCLLYKIVALVTFAAGAQLSAAASRNVAVVPWCLLYKIVALVTFAAGAQKLKRAPSMANEKRKRKR